jgi:signal peptidase II
MLHSHGTVQFVIVTLLTMLVTYFLARHAFRRLQDGHAVWWEVLALSGAVSNLCDRFFHGGVIDFIRFSAGNLLFPAFNVADACIVVGVFFMLIMLLKEDSSSASKS